jgi:hypothetical protein
MPNTEPTPSQNPNVELDTAAWNLLEAKRMEDDARDHRLAMEEQLIRLIGLKEEGTQTVKTQYFKASTTQSLNRSLAHNWQALLATEDPAITNDLIKYKPEINVTGLKNLATANPDAYRRVLPAILTRPAKPAVKVELLKEAA